MKKLLFIILNVLLLVNTGRSQTVVPQYYVGTLTGTGAGANSWPFASFSGGSNMVQLLYFTNNTNPINNFTSTPPTGFITKIYVKPASTGSATYSNLLIRMGNTTLTTLTSGTWNNALTTVYSNASVTLSGTSGQWLGIPLNTPFYYDNTQQLIVEISQGGFVSGFTLSFSNGTVNTRMYGVNTATTSTGADNEVYHFGIDIFAGFPCTDTPRSLVNAPLKVCPGDTFKVQPATFYANATYKWQYSYNGVTWSNVTAPLGLYGDFQDVIYAPKWYRCKISCNANPGLTYTTPGKLVDIRPFYYCYCKNKASVATGLDIGNFTVVNNSNGVELLDNGNPLPALNNTAAIQNYTSYMDTFANSQPAVPVTLYRDSSYRFRVTQMNSGPSVTSGTAIVYLDWNRDGIYDTVTERVLQKTITAANNTTEDTFMIPDNAQIGLTGMRVVIQNGFWGPACGTYGDGETEDYLANISYEPCKGPVTGGSVAGDTSVCVGYDYVVTDTTYERRKSGFSRHWQVSGDNKLWFDIAGSDNKDTLARVFTGQPLLYRNQLVCGPTNDTTYSQTLRVNLKAGYKCYCFSQAIGGRALDSSDIGGFSLAGIVHNDGGTHLQNPTATRKRTDHTDEPPIEIDADSTYQLAVFHTMTSLTHADAKVTIFMDFNNNNIYDLPEDLVYTGYTSVSNFTLIDNVVVKPIAIMNVPTGLRVILNNDIAPNIPSDQACGTYTSGETEDYMIMFRRKSSTNVSNITGISDLGLYPNPTSGKFSMVFSSEQSIKTMDVKITDVTGREVRKEQYELSGGKFIRDIDMSGSAKGVYFVELSAAGEKMIRKLVVQ